MARTKIKVTALAHNAGIALPTGTNVDQANGMYIAAADLEPESIPANKGLDLAVIVVYNTDVADHNITIHAGGAEPDSSFSPWPAFRGSLGDLVVTVAHSSTVPFVIGPFETSRFKQPDGTVNVDFAASFAGTIQVLLLPKAPYVA